MIAQSAQFSISKARHRHFLLLCCACAQHNGLRYLITRIRPNFWGAQFLRIAISKHFAGKIFADQEFWKYSILKFHALNFRGLLKSAKTAKIMRLENLDIYGSATQSYMREEKREWGHNTLPALNPFLLADTTSRQRLRPGQNIEEKKEKK